MSKIKVLSISAPGGDRGPAVGYRNHLAALSSENFEISELTQDIWDRPDLMREFDCAWAYVRFNPLILHRCIDLGIPVIGGPNIALERADEGISDLWEKWYLEESPVQINLNVADYYRDRVESFVKSKMKCKTLEYCYETNLGEIPRDSERKNDVLVYVKNRVNDIIASEISEKFCKMLSEENLSHKVINYGDYTREEYLKDCKNSRVTAWFSIEDYCSLAQIESHLAGSCVVGTQFNLTIPIFQENVCRDSQKIKNWVEWNDAQTVAEDYFRATKETLSIKNLTNLTVNACKQRHSYSYYRSNVEKIINSLK